MRFHLLLLTLRAEIVVLFNTRKAKENNRDIPGTTTLRGRLDGIYAIARLARTIVLSPKGLEAQRMVLCAELEALDLFLRDISDRYHKELPLGTDELKDVILGDEIAVIRTLVNTVCKLAGTADSPSAVMLHRQAESVCDMMSELATWLVFGLESDAMLMAEYGRMVCSDYISNRFIGDMQRKPEPLLSSDDRNRIFARTEVIRKKVNSLANNVIERNGRTVRYDALGRYLWRIRYDAVCDDPEKSVLFLIQTYTLLLGKLGIPFCYSKVNTKTVSGNVGQDSTRRAAENRIRQVSKIITENCNKYFINGTWKERVAVLLGEMLECECKDLVYERLLSDKYFKFAHQIMGVLINRKIITGGTCEEVVRSMRLFDNVTGKPSIDSRVRYMRRLEDGAEIMEWFNARITELNGGKWEVAS